MSTPPTLNAVFDDPVVYQVAPFLIKLHCIPLPNPHPPPLWPFPWRVLQRLGGWAAPTRLCCYFKTTVDTKTQKVPLSVVAWTARRNVASLHPHEQRQSCHARVRHSDQWFSPDFWAKMRKGAHKSCPRKTRFPSYVQNKGRNAANQQISRKLAGHTRQGHCLPHRLARTGAQLTSHTRNKCHAALG